MDRLDTLFLGCAKYFFFLSDLEISQAPELKRRDAIVVRRDNCFKQNAGVGRKEGGGLK